MTTPDTAQVNPYLNAEQLRFIQHVHGPGVLQASIGTGKTLALAERAARAIGQGMDPRRILCVTFTNRAAEEMRSRIMRRCGPERRHVRVSTFHALCAWMLRVEAKEIGLPRDFTIFDEVDTLAVLKHLAGERSMWSEKNLNELAQRIAQRKAAAPRDTLNPALSFAALYSGLPDAVRQLVHRYQQTLRDYHAVDFADLVFFARCMLFCNPRIAERWKKRFDMVQVDEVQDTHMAEYEVVSLLAKASGNLVLAGDFDQTIYEWRGSHPERVLRQYHRDFPDAERFRFTINYRSTRALLDVAASVARSFSPHEPPAPCDSARDGEPAVTFFARDDKEEARWIATQVQGLHAKRGVGFDRMAVLVRTNHRAQEISQAFQASGIPHLTVERFEFFRRQEVKDVLAYLRFLANPWDESSLRRLIARPSRGIGAQTLASIAAASDVGLRLMDLVNEQSLVAGDPLGPLMDAWTDGDVVVFDTETTGLDPSTDEIVELAAVRLHRGQPVATFHQYLQNTVPVGESEAVHGLSDALLREKGAAPRQVLRDFAEFVGSSVLVGHNVGFDIRMLRSNARRRNAPFPENTYFDTLDIAKRFVEAEDYKLETLAGHFNLGHMPQHHALDDVKATCELLSPLLARAAETSEQRRRVVARFVGAFAELAAEVTQFRAMLDRRPPELLDAVLQESGLFQFYANEPGRQANLMELRRIMWQADRSELGPRESLDAFLTLASLSRNVDRLADDEDRVKVLTVHQSKGLEFDVVFVAGLSENEFPGYRALRDDTEAEERRVFYVAVTRARERLFLSGHGRSQGWDRRPSRYFALIGDSWVADRSQGFRRARSW